MAAVRRDGDDDAHPGLLVRALHTGAGYAQWLCGMYAGDPARFNRARWELIRSLLPQAPPSADERGVGSADLVVSAPPEPGVREAPPSVRARHFWPTAPPPAARAAAPLVLLYFHGGGMAIESGRARPWHDLVGALVRRLGCEAYSVDYRLAPEQPFPMGLEDAYTALRWLHASDAHARCRVVLGGDSAGANLALVLWLLARRAVRPDGARAERRGSEALARRVAHLALIYPWLIEPGWPSESPGQPDFLLPAALRRFFRDAYLAAAPPGEGREALLRDWRVSPLRAAPFDGCPPTTVISAALDPLRDSNEALVRELRASHRAGAVDHWQAPGAVHGFLSLPALVADGALSARAIERIAEGVERSLAAQQGSDRGARPRGSLWRQTRGDDGRQGRQGVSTTPQSSGTPTTGAASRSAVTVMGIRGGRKRTRPRAREGETPRGVDT